MATKNYFFLAAIAQASPQTPLSFVNTNEIHYDKTSKTFADKI